MPRSTRLLKHPDMPCRTDLIPSVHRSRRSTTRFIRLIPGSSSIVSRRQLKAAAHRIVLIVRRGISSWDCVTRNREPARRADKSFCRMVLMASSIWKAKQVGRYSIHRWLLPLYGARRRHVPLWPLLVFRCAPGPEPDDISERGGQSNQSFERSGRLVWRVSIADVADAFSNGDV
jgi:hypothetical protein